MFAVKVALRLLVQLLGGQVGSVLGFGEEDRRNLGSRVSLRYIAIVELDEAVHGQVFLSRGEVDDKGAGDVVEHVKFVGLTEGDHVPQQALFVAHLAVELEVVEGQAVLAQAVELEPEGCLRPLEDDALCVVGFLQAASLLYHPPDSFMSVAPPQKIVPIVLSELFYGFHLGGETEDVVVVGVALYEAFGGALAGAEEQVDLLLRGFGPFFG